MQYMTYELRYVLLPAFICILEFIDCFGLGNKKKNSQHIAL